LYIYAIFYYIIVTNNNQKTENKTIPTHLFTNNKKPPIKTIEWYKISPPTLKTLKNPPKNNKN
jgi:hypothetical protein